MGEEGRWLRTDENEDVAVSIRHVLRSREFTKDDPHEWKWVALALHSALQGACVCHLVTTAGPVGAVTERNAREWLNYFEASRHDPDAKPPRTRLLELPDLLKAVRKRGSAGDGCDRPGIALSDRELNLLRHFHKEIRNQFTHFEPQGWSIEISGLPKLAEIVSRMIGEMMDQGWAFRHKTLAWKSALKTDLTSLAAPKWFSDESR